MQEINLKSDVTCRCVRFTELFLEVKTNMRMRAVNGGRVFDSSGFIDLNMM